jgi:hypothetical protein
MGVWCDQAFMEKIDKARGTRARSEFCRQAIAEKLRGLGFDVPESEITPPDRTGKGGPRRIHYPVSTYRAELNEPSPKGRSGSKRGVKRRAGGKS